MAARVGTMLAVDILITLAVVFAVAAAGTTFAVTRTDLGGGRAALLAAGAGLAVGLGWFFVVYLAPFAFLVALGAYLVARRWLRAGRALFAAGTVFAAALVTSGVAFWIALDTM